MAKSPLEAVEQLDEAFNRGDLEAILSFYEEGATMVVEPGRLASGKPQLRSAYEWILSNIKGTARQEKTHVIESDDIALFTSKWSYNGTTPDGTKVSRESYASVILRKQPDGDWLIVVDNSWGPAVLE
ncbi:MAG TPA: SgcJ/EcaC family oxidoreductase [Pyrinomonadaceae bacterium]|jgi:uncharacterized protein (TIGR02246 family)